MKKYINIIFWIIFATYLFVVLGFVFKKQKSALCTSININFLDTISHKYINNEDYLLLHNNWANSGYDIWLCPSFDRIDDYKAYSFNNLNKWMTWKENRTKGSLDRKEGRNNKVSRAIIGTNIKTGEIIHIHSGRESERKGFSRKCIYSCCLGNQKAHRGYTWEYKI